MIKKTNIRIVLVDHQDKVVGYREKVAAHKNPVPLHRAVSVVIYSPDKKKMLIQKRADNKPTWPDFWSNACCTHSLPKETYKVAAERRLKEEMGIATPLKKLFTIIYQAEYDKIWGEHEFDVVFAGRYQGFVSPDPREVKDYLWINVQELLTDIKQNPQKYTPWFKTILKKIE